jgi:hypothetical protein
MEISFAEQKLDVIVSCTENDKWYHFSYLKMHYSS